MGITIGRSWSLLAGLAMLLALPPRAAAEEVHFLQDVAPVLVQRCAACHGGQKAKGDYRLHTFDELLKPGGSDEKPVVPGKPDESELYRRITESDAAKRMPPGDDPLAPAEVEAVRRWIAAGAAFDGQDRAAALKSILPPRKHPAAPEAYRVAIPVFAVAFAPDGAELAVGGYHEVTVWDVQTGALRRRLAGLPQRIQALAYSPDGARLLVGGGTPGEYGEAALIDAASGAKVRTYGTFDDLVHGAAFSRDGGRVAAGSADRSVRVYRAGDGGLLWQAQPHSDWVTAVAFSPDGRFLLSASKDRTVKVFDAGSGALFTTFNGHRMQFGRHTGQLPVYDVTYGPDGPTAFSAGDGKAIRSWDPVKAQEENGSASDMELRFVKFGHTRFLEHTSAKPVFKLAVRDGQVFSAAGDGVVRQHDAASGKLVREYKGHADWVYAVDCHPQSGRVASGAFDGEVRIWDVTTGACVRAFKAAPGLVTPPGPPERAVQCR
jgi:hypothetical protein